MEIRYAKREELNEVNALRKTVNELHVSGRPDIFREGFCKELEAHALTVLDGESSDIIVALIDGEICGFACVEFVKRPETAYNLERKYCHIEELGVAVKYRRQGVATALLEFCSAEAKRRGFSKIELDVWEFNDSAIAFYESSGFKTYRRLLELEL